MIKITIIIPVYNSEQYLADCLDSVVNQSLKEIQVIAVNDGSTDGSLQILNEYALKDLRIEVIDKKNEGAGIARNVGIEKAKGIYILCVDSDDLINTDTCKVLYETAYNNDLDFLQVRRLREFTEDQHIDINEKIDQDVIHTIPVQSGKAFSLHSYSTSFACGKLWKNSLIKKAGLCFSDNRVGEDQLMSFKSYVFAERFLLIDFRCYYYRTHSLSATSGHKDLLYLKNHSEIAVKMLKIIEDQSLWDHYGFVKRLFIILYRLNLHSVRNKNLDPQLFKSYRNQMKEARRKCKANRKRGARFRFKVERFFLLPPVLWRTFKM